VDALLERFNRVESHKGLPAFAPSSALWLHHTQAVIRILEIGLLRIIAQRLQQSCASAGEAWSAHPARTAGHQS
jgi:hypothetical protein